MARHPHYHDRVDHVFVVLDGSVLVTVGDGRHVLEAGDTAWVPRGEVHGIGTDLHAGTLLSIDAPQPLDGYFRELAAAFPAGTSPATVRQGHCSSPSIRPSILAKWAGGYLPSAIPHN